MTTPLSSLCTRITKGTTPTTLGHRFQQRGVNFVKSEAISDDGHIDHSTFAFIDLATHHALQRSILQEGDVLFSMAGVYLGKTAVVTREILPANTNQAVGIIRLDHAKAVPRFIHYALSSPECRGLVHRSVAQSAQPNFNLREIGGLPIPAWSLPEQRAIAHILGTLDDKIELNRRMNETLEAMARALFKSWFVDFDPVRAKAAGRDPGLPRAIADLFPSLLTDSPSGTVPTGWSMGTVGDICELSRDVITPGDHPAERLSHYSLPAFDDGRDPAQELGGEIKSNKFLVTPGSVLLSKLNPHIPRIWLPDLIPGVTAVCSTEFLVAVPTAMSTQSHLFGLLSSDAFTQELSGLVTGTTGSHQRVSPEAFLRISTALAPRNVVDAYSSVAAPLFRRVAGNGRESRTLAALRHTLLPKLISGEIRLKDPERFIAEASA